MKTKTFRTLQLLAGIYGVLYCIFAIESFIQDDLKISEKNGIVYIFLLFIYLTGFGFSWKREKTAGIILMIWNTCVWIFSLYLARDGDSAMFCIMALPVLIISALLVLSSYKSSANPALTTEKQWRLVLRILLINYAVLYTIVVFSELTANHSINYFTMPFLLFPLLLIIFVVGFILSWKRELAAGFVFLLWFGVLIAGSLTYSQIWNSGPWLFFAIPILLQGLFYAQNHFLYRPKKHI
jgi:hypothetical protein